MEKLDSIKMLPRFTELAKKMSPTSRVVLTPDGKDITTIGLWQRCKRFFTVSRVDRREANKNLVKMFEKAISEDYGSMAAKSFTASLSMNPTKLSARKINKIMKLAVCFPKVSADSQLSVPHVGSNANQTTTAPTEVPDLNTLEKETKELPQVDQAKLRVKEQLGNISANSTLSGRSFNNLVISATQIISGSAYAVVTKGDYEWETYTEICASGNTVDFPENVVFPIGHDGERNRDSGNLFIQDTICFVPDTHETAKSSGKDVLFPPNSKFVVSSTKFDDRGCLLVYLSLQADPTTEK